MKIEMSESLVASWLKHFKHCVVVNTNWKASPYWTPAVADDTISQIYSLAFAYFNGHELPILDDPNSAPENNVGEDDSADEEHLAFDWHSMLLQTECDAVGLAHSNNNETTIVYAVESAFHRNNVQYSKKKASWRPLHLPGGRVTAWNIALKMFKNALSMYRWYGSRNAHIVFVAPMSSEPNEAEILNACTLVRDFYREQGFDFAFEFYFKHATPGAAGSFAECIKGPVNLAATIVDDTAELYMRGRILDNETESIDVLMLDKARRLLGCENLDEMSGLHLGSSSEVLSAIERIREMIITTTRLENERLFRRQKSLFDRCHGALRAYYSALHGLRNTPSLSDLRRDAHRQSGADAVGEVHNNIIQPQNRLMVELVFHPADQEEFKRRIIASPSHLVSRVLVFENGEIREETWDASGITMASNLTGNIKSSSYWRSRRETGLVRVELTVLN